MEQGLPLFSNITGDLEGGVFSAFNTTSRRGPMALITDPDLCYELGGNFNQFLKRYEQAADFFGCSEYEMAMQIGRFMKTEDLLTALEYMDGYDKADWQTLRA
ncbi:hypothetical protein PCANC_19383 [Puccinia coronata f. sp. avenae]|uniref:Uncharacterized protein n=1 Tax=Puccinia coronata f. sp. avenae TaxID=200324 RepID=A0A2N5UPG2_9BASI|nr:hypothetical protein PCANC_19383 [Puccinia coronata f. sp. avenae]PLW50114.1 hypothetical protein PCASD_01897 [Puccinia coronata f. sp. avenae]